MMKSGGQIKLTVFTPTYNRIHTLFRTYESLLEQDVKEFVWLVIDDGSTDETQKEVKKWMNRDNGFEIQYIYKRNGGMHTAHNMAYENIHTELGVCIDSDDCMGKNAVRLILEKWEQVKDKGYAGIIGLDADMNGKIIGTRFPNRLKETTVAGYYKNGGKGDKKLVYRTDIIQRYPPYPVFEGESYVPLVYKYRLIDQSYKLATLDEVLCNVEYLPDGSTMNMFQQYLKSPKGFAFCRIVSMKYPTSVRRLVADCIHYCAESQHANNKNYIQESPRKILTVMCAPVGRLLLAYIRRKVK